MVWFGEHVPKMDDAVYLVKQADYVLVVGTSLVVYPAAQLIHRASDEAKLFYLDPKAEPIRGLDVTCIKDTATNGIEKFKEFLMKDLENGNREI